jgi:hypothetical protein
MQRFRNIFVLAGVLLCLFGVVGPLWGTAVSTSSQTFILSNEGNNGLITQLVNGGYGNANGYQALVALANNSNPSGAGVLTSAFIQALAAAPASSQIFTATLSSYNSPGTAIAISTDGTVQTVGISGATYSGQAGTTTLVSNISGVGPANFTYSSTSSPLTSFNANGVLGVSTTYNVLGIAWSPSRAVPTVPSLSPFAAILLAAALCAAAIYLMRKRMAGFDLKS